jgi:hypothetical protein
VASDEMKAVKPVTAPAAPSSAALQTPIPSAPAKMPLPVKVKMPFPQGKLPLAPPAAPVRPPQPSPAAPGAAATSGTPAAKGPVKVPMKVPIVPRPARPIATHTPPVVPETSDADIVFERPDSDLDVPANIDMRSFKLFEFLKAACPPWRYRCVEYFLAGGEMFLAALRKDYQDQVNSAKAKKAELARFTWKNGGSLAENFAVAMDQAEALYATLKAQPRLARRMPADFDGFANAAITFLRLESGIPEPILDHEKYRTKFHDWVKGGTRYVVTAESAESKQMKANIKFADVAQRQEKVRKFLARRIDPSASAKSAFELAMESSSTRVSIFDGSSLAGAPAYVPTIRVRQRGAEAPSGPAGSKSAGSKPSGDGAARPSSFGTRLAEDERLEQEIRTALVRLLGGHVSSFPDTMRGAMGDFVKLLQQTRHFGIRKTMLDMVRSSSAAMQASFDRQGGMAAAYRFVTDAMKANDQHNFVRYLELLVEMRCMFSQETKTLWATDPFDSKNNTVEAMATRLKSTGLEDYPKVLQWMRGFQWTLPTGPKAMQDHQFMRQLVERLERNFSHRFRKRLEAPSGGPRIVSRASRAEVNGRPAAVASAIVVDDNGDSLLAMKRMSEIVTTRIRSEREAAAGKEPRRLGGFGPIISPQAGDIPEGMAPDPPGTVDCLCVKCVGAADTMKLFDPYQLLGIERL